MAVVMLCRIALCFAIGVAVVALFNTLPHPGWPLACAAVLLAPASCLNAVHYGWLVQILWLLAALMLGIWHASSSGLARQGSWLAESLAAQDVTVTGRVVDLPWARHERTRFLLDVGAAEHAQNPVVGRLSLIWSEAPDLFCGQMWRLQVRLRPPHGFGSPGANDYEASLLQRGIVATGYVRTGAGQDNRLLGSAHRPLLGWWRARLAGWLSARLHGPGVPLLQALLLGNAGELEARDWDLFRETGTVHLLVVSGLHISLVVLVAACLMRALAWLGLVPLHQVSLPALVPVVGLLLALVYGVLAGFGLPVQRALVMLGTALVCGLAGFRLPLFTLYCLALCAVLLLDPMAVTARGFWLSFVAVAALLYRFSYRHGDGGLGRVFCTQVVVALALTPVLAGMQQSVSLLSPVVNLVSVPLIGVVLLPLMLLGLLLALVVPQAGIFLLQASASGLELWKQGLSFVPVWLPPGGFLPVPGPAAQWAAALGVVLLLSPAGLGWRWTGLLCLFPWLFPLEQRPPDGSAELVVLDVGQGLALVVRTRNHVLVYDTGDRFSPSFSAAGAVMIPWLRQAGVRQLDLIVISHSDRDHIGGLSVVRQHYPAARLLLPGQKEEQKEEQLWNRHWSWDGVDFHMMPSHGGANRSTNDSSCVLQVCAGTDCALLTGDISRRREAELVRDCGSRLRSRVLLVPHHGSNSSSSSVFLDQVRPELALVSAGYFNRFRHPSAAVVRRLQDRGIRVLVTASTGTQWVRLGNRPMLSCWRDRCRGWWRRQQKLPDRL